MKVCAPGKFVGVVASANKSSISRSKLFDGVGAGLVGGSAKAETETASRMIRLQHRFVEIETAIRMDYLVVTGRIPCFVRNSLMMSRLLSFHSGNWLWKPWLPPGTVMSSQMLLLATSLSCSAMDWALVTVVSASP